MRRLRDWAYANRAAVAWVAFIGVAILVIGVRSEHTRTRVERVEREIVTLTPCLQGSDKACQAFLDRLIQAARPDQLRKLRGRRVVTAEQARRIFKQVLREQEKGGGAPRTGKPGPKPPGSP